MRGCMTVPRPEETLNEQMSTAGNCKHPSRAIAYIANEYIHVTHLCLLGEPHH